MSTSKDELQKAGLVAASVVAMFAAIAIGDLQWKHGTGDWKDQYAYGTWKNKVDAGPMNLCRLGPVRGPASMWVALDMQKKDKKVKKKTDAGIVETTTAPSGLMLGKICYYQDPKCFDGGTWFGDAGYADTGLLCVPGADACVPGQQVENPRFDLCDVLNIALPEGMELTKGDEFTRPMIDAELPYEFWQIEAPVAPARCACAGELQDAGCEKLVALDGGDASVWVPAAPGVDMSLWPGKWRGAGCKAQPCGNWGESSIPTECCITECWGKSAGEGRCGNSCGTCAPPLVQSGYSCIQPDAGPDVGP